MRLKGGRTGKRAVICEQLELTGLMKPFDLEVWYGERVAVLGSNGSGKSHFLRLLARGRQRPRRRAPAGRGHADRAGAAPPARPSWAPGSAPAGSCRPTSTPSWSAGRCSRSCTAATAARTAAPAWAASRPPGCWTATSSRTPSEQRFESLSGGQQARFQILLLELSGATLLLLDEPTDNLDVQSAEALEAGLETFEGTVVAVTHDRWFARGFDRYLVYGADGDVYETDGAGLGRGPGAADAMKLRIVDVDPFDPAGLRRRSTRCTPRRCGTARPASSRRLAARRGPGLDGRSRRADASASGGPAGVGGRAVATGWMSGSTVDNTDLANVLVCCSPAERGHGYAADDARPRRGAGPGAGPAPAGRREVVWPYDGGADGAGSADLAWAGRQGFELGLVDVQRRLAAPGRRPTASTRWPPRRRPTTRATQLRSFTGAGARRPRGRLGAR